MHMYKEVHAMVVQHNINSINSNRQLGITTGIIAKSAEKLISGYKINRASDDAAGLAISEKMRRQIRGLTQASLNAQDGISLAQVADGALNEIHEILQRGNELAIKSANDTFTDDERSYINSEYQSLLTDIDRICGATTFNEIKVFEVNAIDDPEGLHQDFLNFLSDLATAVGTDGNGSTVAGDLSASMTELFDNLSYSSTQFSVTGPTTDDSDLEEIAERVNETSIPYAGQGILETYSEMKDAIGSSTEISVSVSFQEAANMSGALARASGSGTSIGVEINDSIFQYGDWIDYLDGTMIHEMMHGVMGCALSTDSSGSTLSSINDEGGLWFIEGTAQLAAGVCNANWNGFLHTAAGMSDEDEKAEYIKDYVENTMGSVSTEVYGAGALATAYISHLVSDESSISASGLASGLNKILGKIIDGSNWKDAINDLLANASVEGRDETITLDDVLNNMSGKDGTSDEINLLVGSETDNVIAIERYSVNTGVLGINGTDVSTRESALGVIDDIKDALVKTSEVRSNYGATQNRLEHTVKNLDNIVENTTSAESLIRDTDMAAEMVKYSNNNIIAQAGQAMLSQANQSNQGVLSLLA